MSSLVSILVFFIITVTFGSFLVALTSMLGPKTKQNKILKTAYECGFNVPDSELTRVPIKFYLTAILFILFDIEIIFMYPWALVYKDYLSQGKGLYIFLAMFVFLLIFVFGLLWEIKSKALEWD